MTTDQMNLLQNLADGRRPLWIQVGKIGRACERKGWLRVDYGPDDSSDKNKLCCYITTAGRNAMAEHKGVTE